VKTTFGEAGGGRVEIALLDGDESFFH